MSTAEGDRTFRWGLAKIRRMAIATGAAAAASIAAIVLSKTLFGASAHMHGTIDALLIALASATGGGIAVGVLVGGLLLIGRAATKTVVSPHGIYIQRAPWHKNFVRWDEIQGATHRNLNGWRYLYLKTPVSVFGEVGLSLEVDEPSEFRRTIEQHAPPASPLVQALSDDEGL